MMAHAVLHEKRHVRGERRVEYWVYFAVAYPLFLVAAAMRRLAPTRSNETMLSRRRSLFREAGDMAHSAIPWVFSGR